MIGCVFTLGTEVVEIRIQGNQLLFRTSTFGSQFADITGLKFDFQGVIAEYPDLKDKADWKEQAIERFKMKLSQFQSEKDKMKFIIHDLSRWGYVPYAVQEQGKRELSYSKWSYDK